MNRKQRLGIISILAIAFLCIHFTPLKTTGSHPGSTGAPLDLTCAQSGCHSDAQIIPNAIQNTTLSVTGTDSVYTPGQTYTLTLKAKGGGSTAISKFGFELVALKDKDSLNAGQFNITDATRTQLINHLQGSDNRVSVTHQAAGTPALSNNYTEWHFNWTAPPVNEGDLHFYFAVNCSNDDNTENGDRIYLSSLKLKSSVNTSLLEVSVAYEIKAYYKPEDNKLIVTYNLKGKREVQISLYNDSGQLVYYSRPEKQVNTQRHSIQLEEGLKKGTYIVQLKIDGESISKKILVP